MDAGAEKEADRAGIGAEDNTPTAGSALAPGISATLTGFVRF